MLSPSQPNPFRAESRFSVTLADPRSAEVAVYDVGRDLDTGLLFMALEYVRGETLASALARGPMPWQEAATVIAKVARNFKPPAGDAYVRVESARGDMGWYVVSDGTSFPYRWKIRTGSFSAISIIQKLSPKLMIADLMAILGSIDFILADLDR